MATLHENARTDPAAVKEIFETDLSDSALKQHINAAAARVSDIEAADKSVSDHRLQLIETYLAAHIASSQDPRASDVSIGDSNVTFKGGDETTEYFEAADSLDPTGVLSGGGTMQVGVSVPDSRGVDDP